MIDPATHPVRDQRTLVIGNSDGVGLALTRRLLAAGRAVTGISRRASSIETVDRYEHIVADVAAPDYPDVLDGLLRRQGPYGLCVHCAGIGDAFDAADLSGEADVFRVNLLGAVQTISAVVPAMIAVGGGHFLALSSIGDEAISADALSYAASKAGLSSYLAGLALALRPRGVA